MTVADRIAELELRIAELGQRNAELVKENAALRAEQVKLRKEVEEWRRGLRERRKRRSSRSEKKKPKRQKRQPGRRKGHEGASRPKADAVDETIHHLMPDECMCGGCPIENGEQDSVVVEDIPKPARPERTRHVADVGVCDRCGRRVVKKLPGAPPSGGKRVVHTVIGPNAQAFMASLRFEGKMTLPAIGQTMRTWCGLSVTPGGLVQMFHRTAERAAPSYEEIVVHVRRSSVVGLDETGIRQDGMGAWAWIARTDKASLFRIELSRGGWVVDAMLGEGFLGVVCSDFYSAYTRHDDWKHGYCGTHSIRDVKKIAEVSPTPETIEFRDRVQSFYVDAKEAQQHGDAGVRHGIRIKLGKLIANERLGIHPDVARLQRRFDRHFYGILTFVDRPDVPADNCATERDIRFLAHYRKVTGGTRSTKGSRTLAYMMSITQTLRKNGLSLWSYIVALDDAHLNGRSPPSVFASP